MNNRYTWTAAGQDEAAIVESRLKNQIAQRLGLVGFSATSQRDIALAELLATTPKVFNVKAFGAVGDGVADDTLPLTDAIAAAAAEGAGTTWGEGATVVLPPGIYGVTSDIDIPPRVRLVGAAMRSTTIKWIGSSSPTAAVITSNVDDASGFVHGAGLKRITVDANGEAVGVELRGWNEGCELRELQVRLADETLRCWAGDPATQAHRFQNIEVSGLWLYPNAGGVGLSLDGVFSCVFEKPSVDLASGSSPILVGYDLRQNVLGCTFSAAKAEDCTRAFDLGTVGSLSGNVFINPVIQASNAVPGDTTISATTATMAFVVRSAAGTRWGSVLGIREEYGYDYVIYDAATGLNRSGVGGGGGSTTLPGVYSSFDIRTAGSLGVGNSAAATTFGSVARKIEVFSPSGVSLGFVPVYDAIT